MSECSTSTFNIENVKEFNQHSIKLTIDCDSIIISIRKNLFDIYESTFNYEYFKTLILFKGYETINDIKEFINSFIEQNNIKIEEDTNKNFLKLNLISSIPILPNAELTINKRPKLSEETISLIIEQIEKLTKENENIKCEIKQKNKLNETENLIKIEEMEKKIEEQRIKLINSENINNKLEKKINEIELSNKESKIDELEKKINSIKLELETKINELEKRFNIMKLSKIEKKINHKVQLEKCILEKKLTITADKNSISSVSVFPSGNIVSVSYCKAIKIFDKDFKQIQTILNAHDDNIKYIDIKDENNFVTCSNDKNIKTWIKGEIKFKRNINIKNAHDNIINKVIYYSNNNLISCSSDKTIKIWEQKINNYQLIKTLNHSDYIYSTLLIQNKLVSSGLDGTKIWDLNINIENIKQINYFEKVCCDWVYGLNNIDDDRIIIGTDGIIKIISLNEKKIIKDIKIPFECYAIKTIENKGIFLVGGHSKNIIIFRSDNYEKINEIENAHDDSIKGFFELNDTSIGSFSNDKTITIWSI